ncbi:Pre-mRNA-splicing factor CWC24 [Yarrowia sp. B02]|nr:Pre-mRNA-splicing factor CWC24 [Yarrowia sp. B02]
MFKRKKTGGAQKRSAIQDSDSSSDDSDSSNTFKRRRNNTKSAKTEMKEVSKPDFSSTIDHSHSKELAKSEEATKETMLYAKDEDSDSEKFSSGPYKVPFNKPVQVGLKASSNIKSTTSQDYQPDVCKDYKLTGFCGYGDSCKFLHMREDYKAGWQIEREWEIKEGKTEEMPEEKEEEKEEEKKGLPDVCPICKGEFKSPVVTQCGHYFCEKCFLTKHKKKQNCFVCGKNTKGVCKPFKG